MKYLHTDWQQTLNSIELVNFDAWWNLDAKPVEAPNTIAGKPNAWSHVCSLKTAEGKTLYLKRQQDFYPKNLLQRFCKQLTFTREFKNYHLVKSAGIIVYDLIYFESRITNGHRQAIYVAEGLDGFISLDKLIPIWNANGWPPRTDRRRILSPLLETIKNLHSHGILHNALSPRHLFFNLSTDHPYDMPDKIDFRLIDFERLKKLNQRSDKPIQRDLFTLHRRGLHWPNSDRVWFLKNYLEISKLTPEAKTIIREFQKRAKKKLR